MERLHKAGKSFAINSPQSLPTPNLQTMPQAVLGSATRETGVYEIRNYSWAGTAVRRCLPGRPVATILKRRGLLGRCDAVGDSGKAQSAVRASTRLSGSRLGGTDIFLRDRRHSFRSRQGPIDHPIKNWDQRVRREWMMNVSQALLPTLGSQQVSRGCADRALSQSICQPDQQCAIIGGHVDQAHRKIIQVIAHPGRHQRKFYHGKTTEPQSDSEAALPPAHAQIAGEEDQEKHHANLNNAHTALRGEDSLYPRGCIRRICGNRYHTSHQQHDQSGPLEQYSS